MSSSYLIQKILFLTFLFFFLLSSQYTYAQQADSTNAWMKVISNLEQYYVVVDQDFEHPYLINKGDSVQVNPGVRHITVVWKTINDHKFTINAKAGETNKRYIYHSSPNYPRSSYQTIVSQTNLFITTDENSTVYINGEKSGKHIVQTIVKPGTHLLRIEHPEYGTLKKHVQVNNLNVTEVARFNENPNKGKHFQRIIPGVGYLLNGQYVHASVTYATLLGAASAALISNHRYHKKEDLFHQQNAEYLAANSLTEATKYRQEALSTLNEMDNLNKKITAYSVGIAGIYIFSTIQGFLKPKSGYPGSSKYIPDLNVDSSPVTGRLFVKLSFRKNF